MKRAAVIGCSACLDGKYLLRPLDCEYDILVVSYLENSLLAATALGLDTPIIRAILQCKTVVVLNGGVCYKKISDSRILGIYENYANLLKKFGVIFTDGLDFSCCRCDEKLINIEKVQGYGGREIKISKDTIVTPAAYDLAKEKNIIITRNEANDFGKGNG